MVILDGVVTLQAGLVCVGSQNETYTFAITESINSYKQLTDANGNIVIRKSFEDIVIYQGTYLSKTFIVDGSLDQRFFLKTHLLTLQPLKFL